MSKETRWEKRAAKGKKGFIQEFKEFAIRGNMIDLAVGVVIGAAFKAIVDSFIDNLITPIISVLTANEDFAQLALNIGSVRLTYGAFIQSVLNFLLIALVVFLMVKFFNKIRQSHDEEEKEAESSEVDLLKEIRDELKAR